MVGSPNFRVIPPQNLSAGLRADLEGPRIPEGTSLAQVYLHFILEAGGGLEGHQAGHSCPHQVPIWGFPGPHLGAEP